MNSKTKNFEKKIIEVIAREMAIISKRTNESIERFGQIRLDIFTNDLHYSGELKNTIFFTYNDHYKANGGLWMSIGELNHPNLYWEDRGYIKGVATDLEGYLVLRNAKQSLTSNFESSCKFYYPHFRKSVHETEYRSICDKLVADGQKIIDDFLKEEEKRMNAVLKELTGCSLLFYVRTI